KCQLKSNRPTPNIALEYKEGKFIRKFQYSWYTKFPWLTGCDKLNKVFCFYCVIFGGEKEWTIDGISSIKNFIRKSEKHSISKKHLINQEKFHLLGKVRIEHAISVGRRLAAIKHNEQVSINRRLIARMIHVVCFLGKQELAFRGHREHDESLNKGNYLELLDLLAQEEHLLKDHFLSSSIFKGTSKIIQNDLIESVTTVLNSKIFKEIQTANYISIQADETTDVDKTGSGLADVILSVIKKWDLGNKIIAQTYDGASVMSGTKNGVQSLIKNIYPNVLFIHCYAHQLNLVFRSSKRSELLRQQGFKLPNHSDTRWNYHSRAASTIKTHFIELKNAFTHVIEEPNWDHISISTASGILDKLNDAQFVFEDTSELEFVELTNEKMFDIYHNTFPECKLIKLLKQYPNIFEENRLRNELSVIYSDKNKHLPPHKLLDLIIKNNLQEIYSQFTKLCQLVLTIPATTASSERSMSTLKRIKSFLRNTMTNERLTNLSSLAIEKNLLGVMAKDPTFVESIIDDFAKKKERRIELEYKII
ncbi:uncharacterized protein LOC111031697, partial [Myzus persicae]|uniref:uncharacterized protein LOC111031697 n=1 Tax=Myzus persicae TaxID=13164 RepID=UPI000B936D7A